MEQFSTGASEHVIKTEELDIKTEFDDEDSLSNGSDTQFKAVIFGTKYSTQINDESFNTDYIIHEDVKSEFKMYLDPLETRNHISSVHKIKKISIDEENIKDKRNKVKEISIDEENMKNKRNKVKEISIDEENIKNKRNKVKEIPNDEENVKNERKKIKDISIDEENINDKRNKVKEINIDEETINNEHSLYSKSEQSEENILKNKLQYNFDHEIVVKNEIDFTEQFLMDTDVIYEEENAANEEIIESNFTCTKRKTNVQNHKREEFCHRKENVINTDICLKEEILPENDIISLVGYQKEEIHSKKENVKARKDSSKIQENVKTRKDNSKIQENVKSRKDSNVKTRKEICSKIQENVEIPLLIPIGEKKTFMCNDCGYKFNHLGNLKRHISRLHTNTYNINNIQAFSCSNCAFKCSNISTLEKHKNKHKDKPFTCDYCDYSTRHKFGLNRHLKTHTGEKQFTCEICDRKCTTKRGLEFHIMIHSGKKPFSCDKCDFKAVNKHDVIRHGRIHTGEKPFSCEICGYSCIRKYHLSLHMRKHLR